MTSVKNFLTIDFEEWYQGLTSTSGQQDKWHTFESRIVPQTQWLLDAFAKTGTLATFFVIGQVARDHPALIRQIAERGHEIGLHGNMHQPVYRMTREQFREDLAQNLKAVKDACGVMPLGYRAAYASLNENTSWIWDELAAAGLKYDSSVFPIKTPLYGMPGAPRFPYKAGEIQEFPLSTLRLCGVNLPFSGGFYFRALPYCISSCAAKQLNKQGYSVIFYFHPWEFDPGHPMPDCVTPRERLSHYAFLKGTQKKLERLLQDFKCAPLKDAF